MSGNGRGRNRVFRESPKRPRLDETGGDAVTRTYRNEVAEQRRPDTLRGRIMDWWDPRPRYWTTTKPSNDPPGAIDLMITDRWPLIRRTWDAVARFVVLHWKWTITTAIALAMLIVGILGYLQQ